MFINYIRWFLSLPISLLLIPIVYYIISWILKWVFDILYIIMTWGTRYDSPPIFDFEYSIIDFKSFIFDICLSSLIASGICGFIGRIIMPSKWRSQKVSKWYYGLVSILLSIIGAVYFWESEHWFYSTLTIIDLFLMAIIYTAVATIYDEI